MAALMQEATKSPAIQPDSQPTASGLALVLQSLDAAPNITALNARTVQLVRDLVNAKAAAVLSIKPESGSVSFEAGDQAIATALEISKSEFCRQVGASKQVFRFDLNTNSTDAVTYVVAQLSTGEINGCIRFLVIETHPTTGFALALSFERLELLRSIYQNTAAARLMDGKGGVTADFLDAVSGEATTDGKLQIIADQLCRSYDLPELVIAQVANGKPERITFNKTGKPHAASRTLNDVKGAIDESARTWKANAGSDQVAANCHEDWSVAIIGSNGTPAVALAFRPRSALGEQHPSELIAAETATNELHAIATTYKPLLIAAGTNHGLAGAWSKMKAEAFRWRTAAALVVPIALIALIPYPDRVEAPFRLVASEKRVVTAPFDAVLETVNVKTDAIVEKGNTVLARLSTREIDLGISRNIAKKAAAEAKRSLARIAQDPAKIRRAQLEADIADAEIALLTYRKSLAEIKPQLSGVITAAEIENRVGTVITRGQTLFEVADTSSLDIEVFVSDKRILDLATGQDGQISLAAQPGRSLPIKVQSIHPLAEVQSDRSVFRVDASLTENSDPDLRPGMEGVARITTGTSTLGWLAIRDAVNFLRSYFWI